ncbi:hypothetical protein BUALT_Bualt11G0066100 [Buddleja alternifolia]|uniref:Protein PHLOEM PROTEIN 2-LIKE A10 n=1 Tax=Buddleja alternifolia TaxID=168488 RepID=A0AAV6X0A4_9LAMI|nr:hypothetical protein BUALT_Bualt11G0066100 [Buddleja alternifolia]
MDVELMKKGVDYTKKKKKWVLILSAFGFTSYGVYKVYNLPSVIKKRRKFAKLFDAIVSVAETVSDSAAAIGILSKDLKQFLGSDSDQIPQSLKQISKIANSDEFSESVTVITSAFTVGILRGYRQENGVVSGGSGFSDRVIDKLLFSDTGSGFASVVVGSFARNLVTAYYLSNHDNVNYPTSYWDDSRWIDLACEDKYRTLILDCIRLFVSTAVAVYLDKTMDINTYDQIFSGLTNPMHQVKVREVLVSVCNNAVETYIRTTNCPTDPKLIATAKRARDKINEDRGWMSKIVGSALALPRNRKFVRDVTGTVTFETVRSFLEFLLEKLAECVKRSFDVVQHEVVDRGIEVIRYVSCRSCAVATVCITLCLHILNGPWVLVTL